VCVCACACARFLLSRPNSTPYPHQPLPPLPSKHERAFAVLSRFEAPYDTCSKPTIVGHLSRRNGDGCSVAVHAAAADSYACVRMRAARPACNRCVPVRPVQATSTTCTCTIPPPGPGQTSPPPSAAPHPRPGAVMASRRRGASSTCTGAGISPVTKGAGRGEGLGMAWGGPRREGGQTSCYETGGAAARRAWGRLARWQAGVCEHA
jgi:hypothetical protein